MARNRTEFGEMGEEGRTDSREEEETSRKKMKESE